jgi:hypothetical protein
MLNPLVRRFAAVAVMIVGFPCQTTATETLRAGSEFEINSYTTANQYRSAVTIDGEGDFVVVWQSTGQDGDGAGIFGRRVSSAGVAQAVEFQVNVRTAGAQSVPFIGADAAGDFVVVWRSQGQDGDDTGVFARRFDAAGTPLGSEFQVNTYTTGKQAGGGVAISPAGAFVIVWSSAIQDDSSYGVFAQRFDQNGAKLGVEFQVSSFTQGYQGAPSIAAAANGSFVVTWVYYVDVVARLFGPDGAPQATEFQVNTTVDYFQIGPRVAVDGEGGFVVVWTSFGGDGSLTGILAHRFDSSGSAQGTEFQVNRYTVGTQNRPALAVDPNGDFVISWSSVVLDGYGYGVFASIFDSGGTAEISEFQVPTYTSFDQGSPAVSMSSGRFVITWSSHGQDGYDDGIFAQRFVRPAVLDVDGSGAVDPLTDGLLVLRFLLGFGGSTLTTGAVDLDACTRCNAATIVPYLETLD